MTKTNDLLADLAGCISAYTLGTSSLPAGATASDLRDVVADLDAAIGALRRHIIIEPDDPIGLAPNASNAELERQIQQITEASIPSELAAELRVNISPDEDSRMIVGDFAQLSGHQVKFVWDPILKRGIVDISPPVAMVLQTIDPYGEDNSARI